MQIQLLACCIAGGSSTRFPLVGPTNIKAHKFFLYTEKFSYIYRKEVIQVSLYKHLITNLQSFT